MQRAILTGSLMSAGLVGLLIAANHMPPPAPSSTLRAKAPEFLPPRKHAPMPPQPRPPRGKQISIVYAGNGQGEVEPCG